MAKKSTKNRNKKRSRRSVQKRYERLTYLAGALVTFLFIGGFATVLVMNSRNLDQSREQWYVENGSMEILAPAANTLQQSEGNPGEGLPFLFQTPTPEPTEIPSFVAVTPTPQPTFAIPQTEEEEMEELQPEATIEVTSVPITITAVGDCTLGGNVPTGYDRVFAGYAEKYGYDYFFQNVRSLFENDDLTIVNLEGPLTTSDDKRSGRKFNFRGDPDYVNILSGSSVEICNVANNHALDYGESGFAETVEVLHEAGIGASGFSEVYMEEIKGVRVCSLGFTEWAYSEEQIEQAVSLARKNCDLLLVSIHWGDERVYEPLERQRKLGRAIIDAGADIVIGNHSHVYGGVELYNDKYIIYSLGNFCFGGNTNPSDKDCTIFQQTFNVGFDGTVTDGGISIIPARISSVTQTNNFQPTIMDSDQGKKLLTKILKVSTVDTSRVIWKEDSYQNYLTTLSNG